MHYLSFIIILLATLLQAQSPHGVQLKKECSDCHTDQGWTPVSGIMRFKHSETGFPLSGQHQSVQCKNCHTSLVFNEAKSNCVSCHTSIHKSSVSPECSNCHTAQSWVVPQIRQMHNSWRFPLAGRHLNADCNGCHIKSAELNFEPKGLSCFECHITEYRQTKAPNHAEAGFSTDCSQCHQVAAPSFQNVTTDHSFFPLTGGHNIQNCFSCHKQGGFNGLSQDCYSCHATDYSSAVNPNHQQLNFDKNCSTCHNNQAWKPASFNHNTTAFPLSGAHTNVSCGTCHTAGFTGTPKDCISCHRVKYNSTTNPKHATAGFNEDCKTCHSTTAWSPATFNHDGPYFPIYSGSHRGKWSSCNDCHTAPANYAQFSCITCHEHNQQSMDREHRSVGGYTYTANSCFTCHPRGTENGAFNHSISQFPLTGAHLTTDCSLCHTQGYGTANKPPLDCKTCHQQKVTAATNPNHTLAGFISTTCTECHSTSVWKPSSYNHQQATGYALLGGHSTVSCNNCHISTYQNTSQDCFPCHEQAFNQTNDPNHITLQFSHVCTECHTVASWEGASFNHDQTEFPLTGAHLGNECSECHSNGYTNTPTACVQCHEVKFNQTQNPNHQQIGMSTQCKDCHGTVDWTPSTFNHQLTSYPLTGAHITATCSNCHITQTTGTSQVCKTCHQSDFTQSQNPNHQQIGLSQECKDCHTTTAWTPGLFDHQQTAYPLTGSHLSVSCNNCHISQTTGTTSVCYDCHRTKFQQTINPNHTALSLSTECSTCHTTNPQWKPASFPDHNNYWQFQGAHITIRNECQSCHNGNYTNTPETCYGCHQSDFIGVTSPNHRTLLYPTECLACHNQNTWDGATFNHDASWFRIYSGDHRNEWTSCGQCHPTANNYSNYTCISCHEHNQTSMNTEHRNVRNYQYVSSACYNCHRNTLLKSSSLPHPDYLLSGFHKSMDCADCHTSTQKDAQCISCHQQEFRNGHKSSGETKCFTCHSTASFTAGKGRGERFIPEK